MNETTQTSIDHAVIEPRPAPRAVRIAHTDGLPVALPIGPSEPLASDVVDATLRRLRAGRAG